WHPVRVFIQDVHFHGSSSLDDRSVWNHLSRHGSLGWQRKETPTPWREGVGSKKIQYSPITYRSTSSTPSPDVAIPCQPATAGPTGVMGTQDGTALDGGRIEIHRGCTLEAERTSITLHCNIAPFQPSTWPRTLQDADTTLEQVEGKEPFSSRTSFSLGPLV